MSALLEITRRKSFMASLRTATVIINGQERATLKNGQAESIALPPGAHVVEVRIGSAGSAPARLELAEGETVRLGFRLKMGLWAAGELLLTREDGTALEGNAGPAPHHGKLLVILGVAGFLIGILGLAALGQGVVDLRKMAAGKMDPSGHNMTVIGMVLGGVGFGINLAVLILK